MTIEEELAALGGSLVSDAPKESSVDDELKALGATDVTDDHDEIQVGADAVKLGDPTKLDSAFQTFKAKYERPKPFSAHRVWDGVGEVFSGIKNAVVGGAKMAQSVKEVGQDYVQDIYNLGKFHLGGDQSEALQGFEDTQRSEVENVSNFASGAGTATQGLFLDLPYAIGRNAVDLKNWITGGKLTDDELRSRFDNLVQLRGTSDDVVETGGLDGYTAGPAERAEMSAPLPPNATDEQAIATNNQRKLAEGEINQDIQDSSAAMSFALLPQAALNNPVTRAASGAALRVASAPFRGAAMLPGKAMTGHGLLYGLFTHNPGVVAGTLAGAGAKMASGPIARLLTEAGDAMFTGEAIKGGVARRYAAQALQSMSTGGVIGAAFALGADSPESAISSVAGGVASGPIFLFDRFPSAESRGSVMRNRADAVQANEIRESKFGALKEFGEKLIRTDDAAHREGISSLPKSEQDSINYLQGFLGGRTNKNGTQIEVSVLPESTFLQVQRKLTGNSGFNRGFVGPDGNVYLNASPRAQELQGGVDRTARHETGHVAERLAEIIGGDFASELGGKISESLYQDGQPIPEFQKFIEKYSDKFGGKISTEQAEREFLAETVNKILEGKPIDEFAVNSSIGERIRLAASDTMKALGLAPRAKDGTFDWREIPAITSRMRTLLREAGKGQIDRAKTELERIKSEQAKKDDIRTTDDVTTEPEAAPLNVSTAPEPATSVDPFADVGVTAEGIRAARREYVMENGQPPKAIRADKKNKVEGKSSDEIMAEREAEFDTLLGELTAFAREANLDLPANPRDLRMVMREYALDPEGYKARYARTPEPGAPPAPSEAPVDPSVPLKGFEPPGAQPSRPPLSDFDGTQTETTNVPRVGTEVLDRPDGLDLPDVAETQRNPLIPETDQVEAVRNKFPEGSVRESIDVLDANRGKVVYVRDYNSAFKSQEGFGEAERTGEIRRQNADKRKAGEEGTSQDKPFIPTEIRLNRNGEVYVNGFDIDVMFSNLRHAVDFMIQNGIDVPLKTDAEIESALTDYNWNHANGFDGAGLKRLAQPGPGYRMAEANPDAAPRPLDANPEMAQRKADLLNMAVNSKLPDISGPEGSKAVALNLKNQGFRSGEELVSLRKELQDAGFDTSNLLSKRSAFTGRLSADLMRGGVTTDPVQDGRSVRPHGFNVDLAKAFGVGKPQFEAVTAGFLPGDGPVKNSSLKSFKEENSKPLTSFMPAEATSSKIWRAGDADESGVKPWSSWSENKGTAEAYMDNPGFGGDSLRSEPANFQKVLRLKSRGRDGFRELAEEIGLDPEVGEGWFDSGYQYPWEESAKVRRAINEAGFDGVEYIDDFPAGATTIVPTDNYRPAQELASFMPAERKQDSLGFYSALREVAEQKLPNRATPEQILAMLDPAKSGVKKEEIEWMGLPEFIAGKKQVTKQELLDFIDANRVEMQEVTKTEGDTKYGQYALPGGTNYKELLLTLPSTVRYSAKQAEGKWRIYDSESSSYARNENGKIPGWDNESEAIAQAARKNGSGETNFQSSHWNEPNVLAHLRQADFTDQSGANVRLIEEIQSDWHQKGRADGYRGENEAKLKELGKREIEISDRLIELRRKDSLSDSEIAEQSRLSDESQSLSDQIYQLNQEGGTSGVPNAPFKKVWPEVAIKIGLRKAVEEGADKFAWIKGKTAADRFDLSKDVDLVTYNPEAGYLSAQKGTQRIFEKDGVPKEKLAEYIGQEAARKLLETHPDKRGAYSMEGKGLKMGGEGMVGFYDKILPDFVRKYVKKWGGKVETTKLSTVPESDLAALREMDSYKPGSEEVEVHSVTITPEMRESVMAGQPLFLPDGAPLQGFETQPTLAIPRGGAVQSDDRKLQLSDFR